MVGNGASTRRRRQDCEGYSATMNDSHTSAVTMNPLSARCQRAQRALKTEPESPVNVRSESRKRARIPRIDRYMIISLYSETNF
jgi:hypothetical protein